MNASRGSGVRTTPTVDVERAWHGLWGETSRDARLPPPADVRRLLRAGADPDMVVDTSWRRPLHTACDPDLRQRTLADVGQRAAIVRSLIAAGATAGALSADMKRHPLHLAARVDDGCVRTLLAAGAPPDQPDVHGRGPLWHACDAASAGRAKAVRRLLAAGADPSRPDVDGVTPLYRAIACSADERTIAALSVRGIDPASVAVLVHTAGDGWDTLRFAADAAPAPTVATLDDPDPGRIAVAIRVGGAKGGWIAWAAGGCVGSGPDTHPDPAWATAFAAANAGSPWIMRLLAGMHA